MAEDQETEEQKFLRLYGKLPSRATLLNKKLKDRKYFDSGDYALSKAGQAPPSQVGSDHPEPEVVPHSMSTPQQQPQQPSSPVHKQSSLVE